MESVAEFGRDFVSETIKNVRGQAGKFRMETFGELAAGLMHDMFAFVRGVEMHLRDVIEQIDRGADKQAIRIRRSPRFSSMATSVLCAEGCMSTAGGTKQERKTSTSWTLSTTPSSASETPFRRAWK
jgi:hypothetical protein